MPSLDTNCVLRLLLNDIPEQRHRVQALLTTRADVHVDDATIVETVFVLDRVIKLSRGTISASLDTLAAFPVVMNRQLWTQVLGVWQQHPKLSLVDIYLTVKGQENNTGPVYTFDAKMLNQLKGTTPVPPLASAHA